MSSTKITCRLNAPRSRLYRAFLDASAMKQWMVPPGMTSHVHMFEPREGGSFRISLTYDAAPAKGKTTAQTDTYHGHFMRLVPNEKIVEMLEFETDDPELQGAMTLTIDFRDVNGGTELVATHDRLPPGLSPADNEAGWRMSLTKLAQLVESNGV